MNALINWCLKLFFKYLLQSAKKISPSYNYLSPRWTFVKDCYYITAKAFTSSLQRISAFLQTTWT